MKTAVVIVNWQRPQDTIECVRSVKDSLAGDSHIIVVDNGSQDNSLQLILDAFYDIEMVALEKNLGFSGGYNAGIKKALRTPAEYLFLLNNDTTIAPDTIPNLLAANCDMAVPKIFFYDDPERIWAAGAAWRWIPPSVKLIGYRKMDGPSFQSSKPLDYATGCALMVTRKLIEEVGGFDPSFVNYMEDYDFCFKVKQAGFKIGFVPEAVIFHKVSSSLGASSPQVWRYMGQNTVLFYRKANRFPDWMLISFLVWVSIREFLKLNWMNLPAYWTGIKDGFEMLKYGALDGKREM